MQGFITAQEAAEKLGYEYTYFTRLLNQGRVPGAQRWQRVWLVPANTEVQRLSPGRKKLSENPPE